MPSGRKTKYDSDVLIKTDEYIEKALKDFTKLPSIESLAIHLGVVKSTIYQWAKKRVNKEFKERLEDIALYQYERLMNDGIYGGKRINTAIVKMFLINNYNMKSDKIDNNLSGEFESKFSDEQINKIASRILRRRGITGDPASTE